MNDPSYARFLERYPAYRETARLDELRASDYRRLDEGGHTYLDYTGAGMYGESQVREHASVLSQSALGNPHSGSLASIASTGLVEDTRREVLAFFGGTANYTAVFTLNATAALKLVGEAFPFAAGSRYLLTVDNHNSVNGIREFAIARGATVDYAPLTMPDLRVDRAALSERLALADPLRPNLLAFPAQSNFTGVKHPLDIVEEARAKRWSVILDAAAFVPTNALDLSKVQPDFVSISFYKMFGYPTGVGCLLVRKDAWPVLDRPWFAGGTVNFATVQGQQHLLAPREAGFEDGTLNYLSIPAVAIGLRHVKRIGIDMIGTRVKCLTSWLLEELLDLKHSNGRHMVRLYGPANCDMRGGTVTFNIYDPDGHLIDYRRVEELATNERISLRTGCFCNPGAGETAEGLTEDDMMAGAAGGAEMNLPRFMQIIQHRGGKSAGAIRVSLGLASNFADVDRLRSFVARFRDETSLTIGAVTFDIESCRVIRDGA